MRKKNAALLVVSVCLALLAAMPAMSGPQKKEKTMGENEEIMAVLSCMGYGYKVKVLVNGVDLGITGGKSESKRLFDKDNEMAKQATPEIRQKNFMLVHGQNSIVVEYSRTGKAPDDSLDLTLEMENYPAPLFKLTSKKPSGKVEKSLMIQSAVPAGFKTVTVAE